MMLEVATPERLMIRQPITEAQIPAAQGEIGVRPEHAPLIAALGIGILSYVSEGRRREMVVSGGVVEILPDHVRVLADAAEYADEVDVKRAEESLKRAGERLAHVGAGVDIARALNAMKRAQARLAAASHLR